MSLWLVFFCNCWGDRRVYRQIYFNAKQRTLNCVNPRKHHACGMYKLICDPVVFPYRQLLEILKVKNLWGAHRSLCNSCVITHAIKQQIQCLQVQNVSETKCKSLSKRDPFTSTWRPCVITNPSSTVMGRQEVGRRETGSRPRRHNFKPCLRAPRVCSTFLYSPRSPSSKWQQ